MPPGLIEQDDCVRAGRNLGCDLIKMIPAIIARSIRVPTTNAIIDGEPGEPALIAAHHLAVDAIAAARHARMSAATIRPEEPTAGGASHILAPAPTAGSGAQAPWGPYPVHGDSATTFIG